MNRYQPSRQRSLKIILRAPLCLCVLLVGAISISAQSADEIVKRASKAMGGANALRAIKSWKIEGTIVEVKSGASGKFQSAAMQPDLYVFRYDIAGLETSAGHNGKSGWARDSRDGLRTLTGAASRDLQIEALYRNNRWFNYKKDRSRLNFAGQTTINGKPAYAVILTTQKNVKIKMYFDMASGLPVRDEAPAGEVTKIFDYSDFRQVDGVMEPHAITATIGQDRYEIKLDRVLRNPQLDRALFDFPRASNEPLPDIAALLKEVKENEDKLDRLLEKYAYTETTTEREIDSNGNLREREAEVHEVTFYKGFRIRRLVAKNGKPLPPDEEASETRRIEKRIREIEKREAETKKKARQNGEAAKGANDSSEPEPDRVLSIADVLRASKFINPRREQFRGRDVIVFDFEPLPGYKPQNFVEKLFGKLAGAVWIDAVDKQVARAEARMVEPYKIGGGVLASFREGTAFSFEKERINGEIWLPLRRDFNLEAKVFLLKGVSLNRTITYGDYKRFNVEAEKEKLKDPTSTEKALKP